MSSELAAGLSFGILAVLLMMIAAKRGFFTLPTVTWAVPIRLVHVISAFAIYFVTSTFISAIIVSFFRAELLMHYMTYATWLNFSVSLFIFLSLLIYWKTLPFPIRMGIVQRDNEQHQVLEQVRQALYTWIIAFPLVLCVSQLLETILLKLFQIQMLPDQIAVRFLKSTFHNPVHFILAVLAIIVLAPLVEETLFRGFLQTYIRRHLGSKQAILITSVCFSLFHYSAGQGLGNISIITSLFVFSLFLGFIYEKQGTIQAPMFLHAAFNSISVINLYLFGGFTSGL